MIRQTIIEQVAAKTGKSQFLVEEALISILTTMSNGLLAGNRIELRGLGVFEVKPRKQGIGRNPRTKETVVITPGLTIKFKPGKELR